MAIFGLTTTGRIELIIAVAVAVAVILDLMVASYGYGKGFPFVPLFISAVFLGFPLVLLAVTIAAGPQQQFQPSTTRRKGGRARPGSEASKMLEDLGR